MKTLQETIQHFSHLYGRRNRIFLPGLRERIDYLNLSVCDLQDVIRKEQGPQIIGIALARITSRIFCIVEHFWTTPLVEVMGQKYPVGHCSYCQSSPCLCAERRSKAILGTASESQLNWSLRQWQSHLNILYAERNKGKGIENILNRLFKETGELLSLQMMIPVLNVPPSQIEKEFAMELADALAWTIAVANFFNIDLEEEIDSRYGEHCWNCKQSPCVCANFDARPLKLKT